MRRHRRLHKAENFKVKDNVLIRYRPQKRGSLAHWEKRIVVKGTLVKKSKKNHDIYKVRWFVLPTSNEQIEEWISVENIATIRKCEIGNTKQEKTGIARA